MSEDKEDSARTMALMVICDYVSRLQETLKLSWSVAIDKTKPIDDETYSILKRGEGALQRARAIAWSPRPHAGYGSPEKLNDLVVLMEDAIRAYDRA